MSSTGSEAVSRNQVKPRLLGRLAVFATVFVFVCAPTVARGQTGPGGITLVKDGSLDLSGDGVANPGDLIEYTFLVTNDDGECGDGVNSISVSDPSVAPITCPMDSLPNFGDSMTCTGSYAISQDDIDAGFFYNNATVSGMVCDEFTAQAMDDHSQTIPQAPEIEVVKDGALDVGADGVSTPGDLISYNLVVTNTGNVTLISISVTDPLLADLDCPGGIPIGTLSPGDAVTCTGSYAIDQDDIDAGERVNTAAVSGIAGGGTTAPPPAATEPVTDEDTLTVVIPVGAIELEKLGDLDVGADGVATAGDLITYSLTVTNTGNVALENVTLSDPALASFDCPSGHPIPMLEIEDSETCTGTYAITQVDIDAGFKDNTADVTADEVVVTPRAPTTSRQAANQAVLRVAIVQGPAIEVTKDGEPDFGADGVADVGDSIDYTLLVSNPGNVTLTGINVVDPLIPVVTCPSGNPIPTLAPGATESCTGTYVLTAADIAAGSVVNTADAEGLDPIAAPIADDDSDTVTLPIMMPSLPPLGLLVLSVALMAAGAFALRRQRGSR